MRRLPCWSCGRPTLAADLVETHVRSGQTSRDGWWLSADRVVWLRPCCAALFSSMPAPTPARGGESPMSAQLIAAGVIFAGFVAVFLADPTGARSANRRSAAVVDELERRLDKRERRLAERERRLERNT